MTKKLLNEDYFHKSLLPVYTHREIDHITIEELDDTVLKFGVEPTGDVKTFREILEENKNMVCPEGQIWDLVNSVEVTDELLEGGSITIKCQYHDDCKYYVGDYMFDARLFKGYDLTDEEPERIVIDD